MPQYTPEYRIKQLQDKFKQLDDVDWDTTNIESVHRLLNGLEAIQRHLLRAAGKAPKKSFNRR